MPALKNVYSELYRPQFHFSPKENWMNDPNGMVYFQGEYHLFYQHHPFDSVWGPMHWGHAISKDLVHWEHLPIALFPDEHGTIFSGSAVVDHYDSTGFFSGESGLVAIFTHADECPVSKRPRQRQSVAYSHDKGRTWDKYEGNPVLIDESIEDFRDPKVFWFETEKKWIMVIASGDHVRFYSSKDMKLWNFTGEFGKEAGSHLGVWECPDLFQLLINGDPSNKKWVLIVSIGDNPDCPEGSRTQYFIGDFDGKTFKNDNNHQDVLWLDSGRDNYAGVTWSDIPDEDGRRLFIGWMSNWKYANKLPTNPWRSAMTIPRELSIRETEQGVRLFQTPVQELNVLRKELLKIDQPIYLTPELNLLAGYKGKTLEIKAEFELKSASKFGLKVRKSENESTTIGCDSNHCSLYIDRRNSGETGLHKEFPAFHEAPLTANKDHITLHIFVDWSSVEVFVNDGELVLTDLIFPTDSSDELELFVERGSVLLHSLSVYEYGSVWK